MRKSNRAFTLIELLVVIAIIAILAAILFPVFAQAKLAAKKTTALSNAKQVAMANFIYMGDYDDALIKEFFGFPEYPACAWGPGPYYGWRYAMQPYMKNNGLLTDSTNPYFDKNYWNDSFTDGSGKLWQFSTNFAVNNDVIGFANGRCAGPWTPEGLSSLDVVEDVASTILLIPNRTRWNDLKPSFLSTIEAKTPDGNGWCVFTPALGPATAYHCPAGNYGPIHAVGKQTAFVWGDGHAKSKAPLATLRLNDPINDDWASKLAINPRTGTYYTLADRQNFAATAWGEYR